MEKNRIDPLDLECDIPLQEAEVILVKNEDQYEIQLTADDDPALDCITMTLVLEGEKVDVPLCEDEYLYATVGKNGSELFHSIETNSARIKAMLESLDEQAEQEGHEIMEPQVGCPAHDESPSDSMTSVMLLGALILSKKSIFGKLGISGG